MNIGIKYFAEIPSKTVARILPFFQKVLNRSRVGFKKVRDCLRTVNWISKIPVGKRWKALRYTLWSFFAAWLWLALTPAIGRWTRWWSFSPTFGYFFALSLLLWTCALLALPFWVKWLDNQTKAMNSLLEEQKIAFLGATLVPPSVYMAVLLVDKWFLELNWNLHWGKHDWALYFLAFACFSLAAADITLMSRQMAGRMADAIQVLANGIREASKLDFDHTIVTAQQDELGLLSEIFNFMSSLLKSRVDFLRALYKNILVFSGLLSEEKIIAHIPESFKALEEAEEIAVALLNEEDGKMEVVRSAQGRAGVIGLRFGPGEGVFGRILKEPQLLAYPGLDYLAIAQESQSESQLWGKSGFVMAIPILYKGKIKGAIGLYGIYLIDSHLDMKMDQLQGMANQIGVFLENARLYSQITHDRLTGFYTHGYLETELIGALARSKGGQNSITFIMIDLDKFKHINDRYGHAAGNQLLVNVTRTIRSVIRSSDIPARFGGDEFEILLPNTNKSDGTACAKKIHRAVERSEYDIADGVTVKITLSVGVASYPDDAQTAIQLQAAADSALYDAKALGRNGVVVYEKNLKVLSEKLSNGHKTASTPTLKEIRP